MCLGDHLINNYLVTAMYAIIDADGDPVRLQKDIVKFLEMLHEGSITNLLENL